MTDDRAKRRSDADKSAETVCEFFGIKIKTKNTNVAKLLKSDVNEIMSLDVREVGSYVADRLSEEDEGEESPDGPIAEPEDPGLVLDSDPGSEPDSPDDESDPEHRIQSTWESLSKRLDDLDGHL